MTLFNVHGFSNQHRTIRISLEERGPSVDLQMGGIGDAKRRAAYVRVPGSRGGAAGGPTSCCGIRLQSSDSTCFKLDSPAKDVRPRLQRTTAPSKLFLATGPVCQTGGCVRRSSSTGLWPRPLRLCRGGPSSSQQTQAPGGRLKEQGVCTKEGGGQGLDSGEKEEAGCPKYGRDLCLSLSISMAANPYIPGSLCGGPFPLWHFLFSLSLSFRRFFPSSGTQRLDAAVFFVRQFVSLTIVTWSLETSVALFPFPFPFLFPFSSLSSYFAVALC